MTSSRKRSAAGFTLTDVMMGATILVVGFVGLVDAITMGAGMLDTARNQQIASQIIATELDHLRSSSWAYVSTTLPTSTTYVSVAVNSAGTAATDTNSTNGLNDLNYFSLPTNTALMAVARNHTCRLEAFNVSGQSNLRRIVVTVSWTNATGRMTLTRSGEIYVGKNGLQLSYQKN